MKTATFKFGKQLLAVGDPEEWKPYVDIHPDNSVYYSKGGILYSRETGKEVLGKTGRPK